MASYRGAAGRAAAATAALVLFHLAGCGQSGPPTYPVKGRVIFPDGDVKQLAGCIVEFQLQNDHRVRASGEVKEGGDFTLGTYHDGELLQGVIEGMYQARIILTDADDEDGRPHHPPPIHPCYLEFETSNILRGSHERRYCGPGFAAITAPAGFPLINSAAMRQPTACSSAAQVARPRHTADRYRPRKIHQLSRRSPSPSSGG
jgi:predicted small lipoprotein YifL